MSRTFSLVLIAMGSAQIALSFVEAAPGGMVFMAARWIGLGCVAVGLWSLSVKAK